MSNLKFLKEQALNQLQTNISSNQKRYLESDPWIDSYLSGTNWFLESNILETAPVHLQLPTTKTRLFDLENTRRVYAALQHLTPVQASDPRLWAYLTHVGQWEYMRKRWPMEQYAGKPRVKEIIQERYFLMPDRSRALIRNGIARLWWYGYCSYDETRDDPFELTATLLKNLDITQSILERAFSRNIVVTKALLLVLLERERAGRAFYVREKVRDLAKYLVQIGGVTIIDALQEPELRKVVIGKIEQLSATG